MFYCLQTTISLQNANIDGLNKSSLLLYFYIANEMPQLRVACSEFLFICYKTQLDFLIRPPDILRGTKLSHTDMCSYHAGQRYGPPGIIFQSQ